MRQPWLAVGNTLLPSQKGDVLELDELWSFVGGKANTRWLCRRTRQITLGDRSQRSAFWLCEAIPKDYAHWATRSDCWDAYPIAFPARIHRRCGKHEGETNHVERWFGTLRTRLSRLVRRGYSFSRSE